MGKDIVEKGDIVYLEFDGFALQPDGKEQLFDTTHEDQAKEHLIHEEKRLYAPIPILVGQKRLIQGLDEALVGAKVGEDLEATFPQEQAYGRRDPSQVEVVSLTEVLREGLEPQPGKEIFFRKRKGTVVSITAGRVRLDYNNPLAGKPVKYRYKIVSIPESSEDRIRSILEMDYGPSDDFQIKLEGETVDVLLPDFCKYDQKWFVAKYAVVGDFRELLGLKNIRFIEEYRKKEEAAKPVEEATEAAPEDESHKSGGEAEEATEALVGSAEEPPTEPSSPSLPESAPKKRKTASKGKGKPPQEGA